MASTAAAVKNLYSGTTTGVLYTERRQFYLKPNQFAELFPSVTPFLTFTMKANFRSGLADPVFKLFEHQAPWERQYVQVNGTTTTIAAGATGAAAESGAVTFNNITGLNSSIDASYEGLQFEIWDSTLSTKKGVVICTEGTSSTTAKFKNLTETAVTTADDDYFVLIGQATEEGVVSPAAWGDELKIVWNQTQIFRTPIEITGTLYQASLRGANKELARLRADKAAEHKIRMEKAFLFGSSLLGTNLSEADTFTDLDKLVRTSGGKPVRTTIGLIRAVEAYGASTGQYKSNFTVNEATYSYDDFVDDMEIVFQYVPIAGMKDTFIGAKAVSFFAKKAMDKNSGWVINQDSSIDTRGNKVRYLVTPHGDLKLNLTHSLKYEHSNQMLVADPRNIEYVQYRPTSFNANIKTDDGYDGVKDEYFSDAGLGITNVKAHQLFTIS